MINNIKKGFVAYPSQNISLAETINLSINEINQSKICELKSWEDMSITGKFVISEICKEINKADFFICDLTCLNHNVLFELGYAIAKQKKIWMLLNKDIERTFEDFERLKILTTVGYLKYSNSADILTAFYRDLPYEQMEGLTPLEGLSIQPLALLYLKSAIESDASIKLTQKIEGSRFSKITDDPYECPNNLSWYLQQVLATENVLVHFSSQEHRDYRFHNAKNSFVAGLTYGFDKNILMLAHSPYKSPIDYREFLKVHATATECITQAQTFLSNIETESDEDRRKQREYFLKKKAQQKLYNLVVGDYVAEREKENLDEYFIETSIFKEALRNEGHIIYVGAKGVGKSATALQLSKRLTEKNNLVCTITPPAYQFKGIIEILTESLKVSSKGYLAESLWKFLLYSEVLVEIYKKIKQNNKSHNNLTDDEKALVQFVEKENPFVKLNFAERLEYIVIKLQESFKKTIKRDLFYTDILSIIKKLILANFGKKQKLIILIDNLDKAWEKDANLKILSEFLFSLFRVSRSISFNLMKDGPYGQTAPASIIIFLRSDIFYYMRSLARESDKIEYKKICWDDRKMLLRVLDERLASSFVNQSLTAGDVWKKFFVPKIDDQDIQNFIIEHILPKPRDVIVFIKMAIDKAIDRGHAKVEKDDILTAVKEYSQRAFEILIIESGNNIEPIKTFIYELLGSKSIVTYLEISNIFKKVCKNYELDNLIDFLCESSFFGLEIKVDEFVFLHDFESIEKHKVMAKKIALENQDLRRFKINKAFHAYLEVEN